MLREKQNGLSMCIYDTRITRCTVVKIRTLSNCLRKGAML